MKNKKLSFIIHVIGITLLALVLSDFVMYDITSISIFSPMEKASDFEMSDLYNSVLHRRAVQRKSDVIVVSIDGLSRSEVGDLIETIGNHNPKAVGVDVIFQNPNNDDDLLLAQLELCPNIVLDCKVEHAQGENTFFRGVGSYFEQNSSFCFGVANLAAENSRAVVRKFKTSFVTQDEQIPSLSFAMAQLVNPLCQASLDDEVIYYPSVHIEVIDGRKVLEGMYTDELQNGIILLGDTANINDSYLTPLDGEMPGVMIHAHILDTILNNKQITSTPKWLDWIFAIIICLLFAGCNILANWHMGNIGSFFLRVVQIFTVMVLFFIGLFWFTYRNQYINFSAAMMMTAIGMLASDLWFGVYAGYRVVKDEFVKKIKK